jgi:hypothetical protein
VNTLELIERIHAQWPATAVVVVGNELASDYRHLALAAGALEYVDVLEITTQLPAALRLAKHPEGCGAVVSDNTPPRAHEAPNIVDQIAMFCGRLRTVPTGPKRGPYTAWQYVHMCLALVFVPVLVKPFLTSELDLQRYLLLMLALAGITIVEARQFARALHPANTGWRGEVLKGGAIARK